VVPVPAAEPTVSAWRARFDSSAQQGLGELCAELPVLDVEFRRLARFPAVLYLDPCPAEGLRRLTTTIANQWPEAPPYGGAFDAVIPHLTIAHDVAESVMPDIEDDVRSALPVRTSLLEARLYVFDGARWQPRAHLPFRCRRSPGIRPGR